jgi:hypothetical protein
VPRRERTDRARRARQLECLLVGADAFAKHRERARTLRHAGSHDFGSVWHNALVSQVDLIQISQRAITMLARIGRGPQSVIKAELEPTREDYDAVFVGGAAQQAYDGYKTFWLQPPETLSRPSHTEIRCISLPAREIVASEEFPGGYRKIAHLLVPDQIWCRFKFQAPGGTDSLAYDGLVVRGDRWVWFPKPWRLFRDEVEGN